MSHIHLPHDHGREVADVMTHLPNEKNFQMVSELFKQLSDGTRIRIFWILCHCEECVMNLSSMMEMSSPAVSHHLKQLKSAGLIESRRSGKEVFYTAAQTSQVKALHDSIESLISMSCPLEK